MKPIFILVHIFDWCHLHQVEADGFYPFEQGFQVNEGRHTLVDIQLRRADKVRTFGSTKR